MNQTLTSAKYRACGLVVFALILARGQGGSSDTTPRPVSTELQTRSRPRTIEVDQGRASFEVPTVDPEVRTLVIVSALATKGGPFPIKLSARPSHRVRPSERETVQSVRSPRSDLPELLAIPEPVAGLPPDRRTFHLMVGAGDVARETNYLAVQGRLTAVGRRVQVYVDSSDLGVVTESTLRDVVETFDASVFAKVAGRFGPASDVDRDGRFTILFSSWLTRLAGGKTSVDGFVRGADLDVGLDSPFGNRCDMMYLSTALTTGPHLRTILAHEYTHAVSFSRKALVKGSPALEEEGWLDEGVAHLVEDALGFSKSNIDYRVSAFLSRPERYRLVVDDYYAADLFRSHGNRGATYLFLRWCVDRHGPGLLDSLIRSDARGLANLEASTGSTFADLFRRWTVALALSGLDPTSEPEEPYRSLDPRGECDDWVLAGPRTHRVVPGGPVDSWSAEATTAHYAVVEGSTSGAVTIEVSGPPEAELQVTAVPWPSGSGRPELIVRVLPSARGEFVVGAEVVERGGDPVRLGALAWESMVPVGDSRTIRGDLDMLGIASAFGTSALPARGALRSKAIRIPGVKAGDPPLIFKAVGHDARGRRVAAWSEVFPQADSELFSAKNLEFR